MSEDAVARMLEEAADSSYRKGGANASISGSVMSKETVMNKLHELEFPKVNCKNIYWKCRVFIK